MNVDVIKSLFFTEKLPNSLITIREKIETFPFHPAAPRLKQKNPKMPEGCYFESHISVILHQDEKEFLKEIAENNKGHLSRNFFKKIDEHRYVNMITIREYQGTFEGFKQKVENMKNQLNEFGFKYEKEIVEFAIYDTKVSHDYKWLNQQEENTING